MIIWWIIFGVFALFILFLIKAEHSARKIKLAFILIALLLIYFSVIGWFSSDNVDLTTPKGLVNSVYLYFGWLGEKASGMFDVGKDSVTAVGNVIKGNQTTEKQDAYDGRK